VKQEVDSRKLTKRNVSRPGDSGGILAAGQDQDFEQDCYRNCIRFETAWAQKWAQLLFLGCFRMAPIRSKLLILFGGRGRNRTYNLSVKSRMLCQLSYASNQSGFAVRLKPLRTAWAEEKIAADP
jgi:hypothetical protein